MMVLNNKEEDDEIKIKSVSANEANVCLKSVPSHRQSVRGVEFGIFLLYEHDSSFMIGVCFVVVFFFFICIRKWSLRFGTMIQLWSHFLTSLIFYAIMACDSPAAPDAIVNVKSSICLRLSWKMCRLQKI